METSLTPEEFQEKIAKVIAEKFRMLVRSARKRRGALTELAAQIGVKRTMLDQYADGSVPGADVLFTAFLKWDWSIRIESPGATPTWCEFRMSDIDKESKKLKQQPVQLSLFDALTELDEQLEVLKKTVAKAESEIERSLGKRA
jgi:hypothetical protein